MNWLNQLPITLHTFRGLVTLVLLLAFVGLVVWLWTNKNQATYTAAAHLPLVDDAPSPTASTQE